VKSKRYALKDALEIIEAEIQTNNEIEMDKYENIADTAADDDEKNNDDDDKMSVTGSDEIDDPMRPFLSYDSFQNDNDQGTDGCDNFMRPFVSDDDSDTDVNVSSKQDDDTKTTFLINSTTDDDTAVIEPMVSEDDEDHGNETKTVKKTTEHADDKCIRHKNVQKVYTASIRNT